VRGVRLKIRIEDQSGTYDRRVVEIEVEADADTSHETLNVVAERAAEEINTALTRPTTLGRGDRAQGPPL
jgi:hypothetical protein